MIVREAYRNRTVRACRDHYSSVLPLPDDAPVLGPVQDARDHEGCQFCEARRLYLIEVMPDHLRESHRVARNWGTYPHNGAERRIVDESELPSDSDEYDHIVREATSRDLARYEAQ